MGGKRIVRYSLDLLNTEQKLNFLAKEVDNAAVRKKEANERRRIKKKAARKQKAKEDEAKKAAEATTRTIAAAEPLLQEFGIPTSAIA